MDKGRPLQFRQHVSCKISVYMFIVIARYLRHNILYQYTEVYKM